MTDPAVFLAACKARADAAFTPCGEPGHTGHGLECRIEKGWPYDTRPVREAIALAADVPRLVAFAEAILALCDEAEGYAALANDRRREMGQPYSGWHVTPILVVNDIRAAAAEYLIIEETNAE